MGEVKTVFDELLEILESFKYPVYRQGSMEAEAVYPATFITFWESDAPDHAHYDNKDYGTEWWFTVNVYSTNIRTTHELLTNIYTALKAKGFIPTSKGYDVPSDVPSHTGRGFEVLKMQF